MNRSPARLAFFVALLSLSCSETRRVSESESESESSHRGQRDVLTQPVEQRPETGSGSVSFALNMPEGARADVELTRTLHRDPSTDLRGRATWELTVGREGSDTSLDSENLLLEITPTRLPADSANAALVLGSFLASSRIDEHGELTSLRAPSRSVEHVSSCLRTLPRVVRDDPGFRMVAAPLAEEEVLLRASRAVWSSLVFPLGERYELGQERVMEGSSTLAIGGREVPQTTTLRVVGRAPCFDGDEADRCVWAEMRGEPSASELLTVTESMGVRSLRLEQRSSVLTEPLTLVPHRRSLRTERWVTMEMGGRSANIHEVEETTLVFHWRRDSIRASAP